MKIDSRKLTLLILLSASLAFLSAGCGMRKPELKVGGLYSVEDGEGGFRIVKVLVLDDSAAHIAIYANKFPTRPTTVDPSTLTFEGVEDENEEFDEVGMMHLPLARDVFEQDRPVFISQTPVTEEELVGYNMWKEAGADVLR
ncbi:MAG TPA: hypothetical protein VK363_01600 [Pyrinomonadaceae bacterium]|nr:hypothetical protein [Pyrinomonadaceae bacterium]